LAQAQTLARVGFNYYLSHFAVSSMSTTAMWTSKLCNKYPMAWMQENDKASQTELKRLRSLSGGTCADCGHQDNSWASVTHGVFICMTCSDVHRSVGTHITKVKGCTGTYLWGPDELAKMQAMGNQNGNDKFGVKKIEPDASKETKQRFVVEKYEKLSFAGKCCPAPRQDPAKAVAENVRAEQPKPSVRVAAAEQPKPAVRVAATIAPAANAAATQAPRCCVQKAAAVPVEISDSWFDDMFKEDTFFGNSSVAVKLDEITTSKAAQSPTLDTNNSLDAFLNVALLAEATPTPVSISAYPAHLDPFHKMQPAAVTDPFFDWPEF